MTEKIIGVSIVGCCYTRNSFNILKNKNIKVSSYIQRQNPFLFLDDIDTGIHLTQQDIDELGNDDFKHSFNVRMINSLLTGSAQDLLKKNPSDWLVIDTHYMYAPLIRLICPDGNTKLIQSDYSEVIERLVLNNKKYKNYRVEHIIGSINIQYYIDRLISYLKKWDDGKKIILVNGSQSVYSLSNNGAITSMIPSLESNYSSDAMCMAILQKINCYCIRMPDNCISSDGIGIHYTGIFTQYLSNYIEYILSTNIRPELLRTSTILNLWESIYFNEYYLSSTEDLNWTLNHSISRIENTTDVDERNLYVNVLDVLSKRGSVDAAVYLANLFIDGQLVDKNYDLANRYALVAYTHDRNSYDLLYLKTLVFRHNISDFKIIDQLLDSEFENKRLYCYSLILNEIDFSNKTPGVLNYLIKWLDSMLNYVPDITLNSILSKMWSLNDNSTDLKIYKIVKKQIRVHDSYAMEWLGRLYWYGRGTKKNSRIAIRWFYEAIDCGNTWAISEILDILWNTPGKEKIFYKTAYDYATNQSNPYAMEWLGKAFWKGKGVDVDLKQAHYWMECAASHNIIWAKQEVKMISDEMIDVE